MTAFLVEPKPRDPEVKFKVQRGDVSFEYELNHDDGEFSRLLPLRIPDISFVINKYTGQDGEFFRVDTHVNQNENNQKNGYLWDYHTENNTKFTSYELANNTIGVLLGDLNSLKDKLVAGRLTDTEQKLLKG